VSAFCNAGFLLSREGLTGLASQPITCGAIGALVFLGGLGFPVVGEFAGRGWDRARGRRPDRAGLHTRLVLWMSGALLLLPALVLLALERGDAMAHISWPDRLAAALFQLASMRTAGLHTVATATLGPATLFLACAVIVAMFVGRVGPLTAAGAVAGTRVRSRVALPEERVMIG
jgi:trk system potassium uptake protein